MNEMQNNASAFNIYKEQYILSSSLGKKIINIDNFDMNEISNELNVNNEIYDAYKKLDKKKAILLMFLYGKI